MNFWCTILLYNLLRFLVHASSTEKKRALCDTFFRNREPNRVTEINLSYLQNMLIYYPSGEYELSIHFFKEEYCYRIVFVHKGCLVHDRKEHTFFSALNWQWFVSVSAVIIQSFQYHFQIIIFPLNILF